MLRNQNEKKESNSQQDESEEVERNLLDCLD